MSLLLKNNFFVKCILISNFQDCFFNAELDHSIANGDSSKIILNTAYSSNNTLTSVSKMSTLSSKMITEDDTRFSLQTVNNNKKQN